MEHHGIYPIQLIFLSFLIQTHRLIELRHTSVLKYRNLIAQNGKIRNQISRKMSRIQKFANYKSLEFCLVSKICFILNKTPTKHREKCIASARVRTYDQMSVRHTHDQRRPGAILDTSKIVK